ncbi:MAG: hypothetical protein QNJ55_20355 [Xenococcus sp. MO_188.B8]|nr:hypothetical protein [Xenococcus sp. MO_188.B8]
MTFANQIESIISKRHEPAQILAGVTKKWKSLRKELETIEKKRIQHISDISDTQSRYYLRLRNQYSATRVKYARA